jgi:hypothetical protein
MCAMWFVLEFVVNIVSQVYLIPNIVPPTRDVKVDVAEDVIAADHDKPAVGSTCYLAYQ